jgi:hypothetical protein
MKGQVLIVQFLLFFLVGFAVFLMLGNFFSLSSESFRSEIISSTAKLSNSYISASLIKIIDECKGCDYAVIQDKIQNRSAGTPFQVNLQASGLNISTFFQNKFFTSSIHNLNTSLQISNGKAPSDRPITLTFNRTQNKLEVE